MKEIDDFTTAHCYPRFAPQAVFFDMDGVLFNSMPYHAYAWSKTFNDHGFPFSEYEAYMNEGRTGESVINTFYQQRYGRNATKAECDEIYAEKGRNFLACGEVQPIPHIYELLCHVKQMGMAIFIVTGSAQLSLFDKLNVSFPNIFERDKMVTAFDVKYGKPNPEPYLMALKKAQVSPWQAMVVENAPLGVRSAVDAGIFTVAVNTGIIRDEELWKEGANIVLPDMQALDDKLADLISAKL